MNTYVFDERLGCVNGPLGETLAVASSWARRSGRTMHVRRGDGIIISQVPPPAENAGPIFDDRGREIPLPS